MHRRELAYRSRNGLEVWLLWDPRDDALSVRVNDVKEGARYDIPVLDARPLDVFEHPFAYVARYGAGPLAA